MVIPVLLSDSEVGVLTREDDSCIQVVENKFLRAMKGSKKGVQTLQQ